MNGRRGMLQGLSLGAVLRGLGCVLALSLSACFQATTPMPSPGSESHFLQPCAHQSECGSGALSCIAGRCSQSCTHDDACADLALAASCEAAGTGHACDVVCAASSACDAIGAGFSCQQSRCRQPPQGHAPDAGRGAVAPDGGGDAGTPVDAGTGSVKSGMHADAGSGGPHPPDAAMSSGTACTPACAPTPNATNACYDGNCTFVCNAGFGDCNADPADGCETQLDTLDNCGACNSACTQLSCVGGICSSTSCAAGTADCDATSSDGCEVGLAADVHNCGTCGHECASQVLHAGSICQQGFCIMTSCSPGYINKDGNPSNGCELM